MMTNRNKALSSLNPLAKAKTASLPPSFLNANIALYRSNSDNELSNNVFSKSGTDRAETEEVVARGEWEEAGAGSIVANWLALMEEVRTME